jgi:peptidyl-prolyl cis-trans isomerase C
MHRWRAWLGEPLVRFVLLGLLVFAIDRALRVREPAPPLEIEITPAFAQGLAERIARRSGHAPSEEQIEAAIASYVREEALYREAIALGLDSGDLIVRRRLVQKLELYLDARTDAREPSDRALEAWLEAHLETLRQPARTSLELAFFSGADASARAAEAREAIERGTDPSTLGQPFVLGRTLTLRTDAQLDAALGASMATAIAQVPLGSWSAPLDGSAGFFLVRPSARLPSHEPSLDEVRQEARRECLEDERERAREAAIDAIVSRWRVVRDDR